MVKPLPPPKPKPAKLTASTERERRRKIHALAPIRTNNDKNDDDRRQGGAATGRSTGKAAAKGQKGDGEGQTEERGDPLLDLTDAAVKKMIARAKQRGFITL